MDEWEERRETYGNKQGRDEGHSRGVEDKRRKTWSLVMGWRREAKNIVRGTTDKKHGRGDKRRGTIDKGQRTRNMGRGTKDEGTIDKGRETKDKRRGQRDQWWETREKRLYRGPSGETCGKEPKDKKQVPRDEGRETKDVKRWISGEGWETREDERQRLRHEGGQTWNDRLRRRRDENERRDTDGECWEMSEKRQWTNDMGRRIRSNAKPDSTQFCHWIFFKANFFYLRCSKKRS